MKRTAIGVVLDRSGSMQGVWNETMGALASFIEEQQDIDEAQFYGAVFDDRYDLLYRDHPLSLVTSDMFRVHTPRGMTALHDAIGKTITTMGQDFVKSDTPPEKVILVILTDGYENCSKEYTKTAIATLIDQQQQEWGWEIIFLGADLKSVQEAKDIGIPIGNIQQYDSPQDALRFASTTTSNYRE